MGRLLTEKSNRLIDYVSSCTDAEHHKYLCDKAKKWLQDEGIETAIRVGVPLLYSHFPTHPSNYRGISLCKIFENMDGDIRLAMKLRGVPMEDGPLTISGLPWPCQKRIRKYCCMYWELLIQPNVKGDVMTTDWTEEEEEEERCDQEYD